jgi:predicted NBD/HSP70 family sugar kinase
MTHEPISAFSGGVNQSGVRAHNERLLMSVLQRGGAMPGSAIARATGLSPQTVSVILRRLEADGLLLRGTPVKGRVGKPSVPMGLNPDGLYSVGLKIGRRSADLLLIDFTGARRAQLTLTYDYPMPGAVFGFLESGLETILAEMTPDARARVCGVGVAAPFELWHWHELVGAPAGDFLAWRDLDFRAEASARTDLPVFVVNDATAACRAEHVFGRGRAFRDYAYFFVGAFIGGGVVLDHAVFEGRLGNAGALGSLPSTAPDGTRAKLIDTASIHLLESRLIAAGHAPAVLWSQPQDWSEIAEFVEPWLDSTAAALARASLAACSVIDFEAVMIDGAMPPETRDQLVARTRAQLTLCDQRGLIAPRIESGSIGSPSRAIGAAAGPIIAQVLFDRNAGAF